MTSRAPLSRIEFVPLMALMTSSMALAIDAMLPAFPNIGSQFQVGDPKDLQFIVGALFFGFGVGQVFFGPISDAFGRKRPVYIGVGIFMLGSVVSGFANSFEVFLFGRVLQGFGGAAPRIISLALIRDEYKGDAMAEITSLVMTIFILVPAFAPSLGQAILMFASWRAIFVSLFLLGLTIILWFGIRQQETLRKENRIPLKFKNILYGVRETFSQKTTVLAMLVSAFVFAIFVGYLGAVQGMFDYIFNEKENFPIYFGVLALSVGSALFFNSKLVVALGMRKLIIVALIYISVLSNVFGFYLVEFVEGHPPLWLFMTYMILNFFAVGFLFGNLNAMAMEPLGHVAGMGAALIGSTQITISSILGLAIGRMFHESVTPLVFSFGTISLLCVLLMLWESKVVSPK